jgi:uncharacterized protein YfiM (DUF2279 family)
MEKGEKEKRKGEREVASAPIAAATAAVGHVRGIRARRKRESHRC